MAQDAAQAVCGRCGLSGMHFCAPPEDLDLDALAAPVKRRRRSRKAAKDAGTHHETSVAHYLAVYVDDRIERRSKNGAKDRADIGGLRHMGQRIVVQCKEYGGRLEAGPWLNAVDIQRGNDDAGVGFVVAKRKGTTDPGDQIVLMTLRDMVSLLTGERPEEA